MLEDMSKSMVSCDITPFCVEVTASPAAVSVAPASVAVLQARLLSAAFPAYDWQRFYLRRERNSAVKSLDLFAPKKKAAAVGGEPLQLAAGPLFDRAMK